MRTVIYLVKFKIIMNLWESSAKNSNHQSYRGTLEWKFTKFSLDPPSVVTVKPGPFGLRMNAISQLLRWNFWLQLFDHQRYETIAKELNIALICEYTLWLQAEMATTYSLHGYQYRCSLHFPKKTINGQTIPEMEGDVTGHLA